MKRLFYLTVAIFGAWLFAGCFAIALVPTASMERTVLVGDHILVSRLLDGPVLPGTAWRLPRLNSPRRGEVVSFRSPHDPDVIFLKRVVAVGGDTVEMIDGCLLINNSPSVERYVASPLLNRSFARQKIPSGYVFVMGDNRDQSEDSRSFGPIPAASIVGRPMVVVWSCNSLSRNWIDDQGKLRWGFYWTAIRHFYSSTRWSRTATLL